MDSEHLLHPRDFGSVGVSRVHKCTLSTSSITQVPSPYWSGWLESMGEGNLEEWGTYKGGHPALGSQVHTGMKGAGTTVKQEHL